MGKSEIRNQKSEGRKKIRNPKEDLAGVGFDELLSRSHANALSRSHVKRARIQKSWGSQISAFGFSSFLRISGFGFLVSIAGCGYHQMGVDNASLYRQDIQTVAVPVFVNRTYRRGLENELTKSIIQQLEEHSPYKVVPKDRADTILEGEIYAVTVSLQDSDGETGLPQNQQYTISVNFVWKNLRTGDILVQRKNFDQRANFMPTLGESSSVGSTNAIQQLGLAIVQEMEADW